MKNLLLTLSLPIGPLSFLVAYELKKPIAQPWHTLCGYVLFICMLYSFVLCVAFGLRFWIPLVAAFSTGIWLGGFSRLNETFDPFQDTKM